ncbi:SLAP domain-containing protein [Lactobacillus sp. IBH004]|uniref:SLAP domain-containing protein n=1 Tax=Lactobacillus sp. IBH004 TaxID=2879107 RepID=UPI0022441654|nr:SLAP domain-containing protein [Lactobacillus sp. IBH004]UZN42553.1 SLAP domain-containing protein [Lactobacillus sp. IBH004]
MKKNLRIVSAAAAALLAVAPVAAGTVSTVSADVSTRAADPSYYTLSAGLDVFGAEGINGGEAASFITFGLHFNGGNANVPNAKVVTRGDTFIYQKDDVTFADGVATIKSGAKPVSTLEKGTDYVAANRYAKITGLNPGQTYNLNVNGGTRQIVATNPGGESDEFVLAQSFKTSYQAMVGAPYVYTKSDNRRAAAGSVGLVKGFYSVDAVVNAINAKYGVGVDSISSSNTANSAGIISGRFTQLAQDVRDGLVKAITINSDGTFAKPSAPITFPVNIAAGRNTSTFNVTVYPDAVDADFSFPRIKFAGESANTPAHFGTGDVVNVNGEGFNYVALNGTVNEPLITSRFSATMSENNNTAIPVKVDTTKVNTTVAGVYPVTVSATNAEGKTSSVLFYITVGDPSATYTTVQADIDNVPVYDISGNVVTDTKTTVKNGDKIATYGTVTVNGKSYTRINSANSTKFVETKYVDGSIKPVAATPKKIMHNSYIYDKDHKRVGTKTLAAYSTVNVYGDPTKLADGSLVYKIGDNQYVMADNIDGTARVLSHNAYVYKTSKKRADRRVLKKGSTVVTFGSPYTFKNGKAYYRIGGPAKQYVKVANFK